MKEWIKTKNKYLIWKKAIKLTEKDLHKVINESVKKILKEYNSSFDYPELESKRPLDYLGAFEESHLITNQDISYHKAASYFSFYLDYILRDLKSNYLAHKEEAENYLLATEGLIEYMGNITRVAEELRAKASEFKARIENNK